MYRRMSRRKQSRPQSFKQFLEEWKSPNKSEDDNDSTSSTGAKDEDSGCHGNQMESTMPEEFMDGDDGIVAASHITADKVFGPFQGSVIKADPESKSEDNKDKTPCQQISDSDDTLHMLSINDEVSQYNQQWLTQITYKMDGANIDLHSKDEESRMETLKSATNMDKEANSPENQVTSSETALTSSETAVTSSLTDVTSSEQVVIKTEPTDSDTNIDSGKEGMIETCDSVKPETETETESVARITHETMDKGPPFNCQHCCIKFRNPDNLEAHRTYYCPTTATQPLPASMRWVPPGANTIIKRRNRTPKVPKPTTVPYQVRTSTPPSTSSHGNIEEKTTGTYVCQLCQSSFTNHTNCESHMLLLHCDETVNLCKFCNFITPSVAQLKVHVFSHVKYFMSSASHSPEPSGVNRRSPVLAFRVKDNAALNRVKFLESQEGILDDTDNHNVSSPGQTTTTDISISTKVEAEKSASPSRHSPPVVDNEGSEPHGDSEKKAECEGQYSCGHCNFETREKQVFEAHMNQHQLPVLKIPSTSRPSGSFPNVTRVLSPKLEQVEAAANKCHECNIVFMSRRNFVAHKQFYCAGRHSQTSPELPSQAPSVSMITAEPSASELHHHQVSSQPPGSPKSNSSNSSQNLTSAPTKVDDNNPPQSNSSSSNPSTPSLLPTMVQLRGPRPPVSSQSSSPSMGSPPPPPYIVPTGTVLSGITQQGAPVLLVAVPFPQAAGGVRSENLVPSVPVTSEEDKPLDLSVKASRSSPEGSPSASRVVGTVSPRSTEEGDHPAIVIDLSSVTQSNLRSPPPVLLEPQVEQLNECKKCDIVFNKYESLLAHKQYYCASRHLRGRQIEMSYQQNVACSTSPSGSPRVDNVENIDEKTQSYSKLSNSPNHALRVSRSSPTEIADSDGKPVSTRNDSASVVIKEEYTSSPKVSAINPTTLSSTESSGTEILTSQGKTDSNMSETEPIDKDSSLLGLKFKSATKHNQPASVQESITATGSKDTGQTISSEQSTYKELDNLKYTVPPERLTSGNQSAAVELAKQTPAVELAKQTSAVEFTKQIPRPYSCPACTVSFMRLESLDVHQKFYCAARNVDESPPHPMLRIPKVVSLPAIPEKDNEGGDGVGTSAESNPHRDTLFCKGCGQYFATSKQVRRHSCKNGASHVSASQGTFEPNRAPKRRNPEQTVSSGGNRTMEVDIAGKPNKRYKNDTVVENSQDVSSKETNGVVIKQEIVDSSYCRMSSAPKCEEKYSDKETGEQTSSQGMLQQVATKVKHEDESGMSTSCHNGSTFSNKENSRGLTSCDSSHKDPSISQRTVITTSAMLKNEDGNSKTLLNNTETPISHNTTMGGVFTNCSSSSNTTTHITTVASDIRVKTSSHCRVTSGANLSGCGRVIQQPPVKHCSTCNIDFNSLSNFIAHKKYYCSARQQAKS